MRYAINITQASACYSFIIKQWRFTSNGFTLNHVVVYMIADSKSMCYFPSTLHSVQHDVLRSLNKEPLLVCITRWLEEHTRTPRSAHFADSWHLLTIIPDLNAEEQYNCS